MSIKQAVILAAGLGTRISPVSNISPKSLAICAKRPFLSHLLDQLSGAGIEEVIIITSYLSEQFLNYSRKYNSENQRLTIELVEQPIGYETGRRCVEINEKLDERFLLCYSDNYAPINLSEYLSNTNQRMNSLVAYENNRQYSKSNISLDGEKLAKYSHDRTEPDTTHVNLGYYILSRSIFNNFKLADSNMTIENIIFSDADSIENITVHECKRKYYSVSNANQRHIFQNANLYLLIVME